MNKYLILVLLMMSYSASLLAQKSEYKAMASAPCDYVDELPSDKFQGARSFCTAVSIPDSLSMLPKSNRANVIFYKTLKAGAPTYHISLLTTSPSADITRKGVTILLTNGKKITKPLAVVKQSVEEVDGSPTFSVSSYIALTEADLTALKATAIDEFQLYKSQQIVQHAEMIRSMLVCLTSKK